MPKSEEKWHRPRAPFRDSHVALGRQGIFRKKFLPLLTCPSNDSLDYARDDYASGKRKGVD